MGHELENRLESYNIKPTAIRLLVLKEILQSRNAINFYELEQKFDQVERSTLYRTLKIFEDSHLIHPISDGTGSGKFEYDPEKITKDEITSLINSTGHYHVEREIVQTPKIETVAFGVSGMTCNHCEQTITKKFSGIDGIVSKDISYSEANERFEYDPEKISKEEIASLIDSTGHYKVAGEITKKCATCHCRQRYAWIYQTY